jgi:hypothetical protein
MSKRERGTIDPMKLDRLAKSTKGDWKISSKKEFKRNKEFDILGATDLVRFK